MITATKNKETRNNILTFFMRYFTGMLAKIRDKTSYKIFLRLEINPY